MKSFNVEFAFDDQAGTYTCYAKNVREAIDTFALMVEEMGVEVDLLRVYESDNTEAAGALHG